MSDRQDPAETVATHRVFVHTSDGIGTSVPHDPLCNYAPDTPWLDISCECDYIRSIREDERYNLRTLGNTYDYDHGDQCPAYGNRRGTVYDPPCTCNGAYSRGLDDGYAAALRDAVEAVKSAWDDYDAPLCECTAEPCAGCVVWARAVAAIEALGGER